MLFALNVPVISKISRSSMWLGMCEECLKDFAAKLMIDTRTFANLKNRVKGIEYLKGKSRYIEESDGVT
jgi:hypothetical protein